MNVEAGLDAMMFSKISSIAFTDRVRAEFFLVDRCLGTLKKITSIIKKNIFL